MSIDRATWRQVGALFDHMSELEPDQRRNHLEKVDPPHRVVALLDKLLQAHDAPDEMLLDQAIDDLLYDLFDGVSDRIRVPENLSGSLFGKWRAVEQIGQGGMAVVLRGERADGEFHKEVAIKLLPPGLAGVGKLERLRSEIRLLARLDHPGIARLLDSGLSEEGIPYLVMEYVDGLPIDRYCQEHQVSLGQRIDMVLRVAEAVAYSHARLVVHCDIKPDNVLVSQQEGQPPRVKLVDFGIAGLLADDLENSDWSPAWHCSPAYASPDQLNGEPPSVAQDVYLLGALLYRLLTGRPVRNARQATTALLGKWAGNDIIEPPSRHSDPELGSAVRADEELDAICLKALASEPEQRYADVGEMVDDLQAWRQSRPVAAVDGGPGYRARKWMGRNRLVAATIALAVVSVLSGLIVAVWQAREAEQAAVALRIESDRANVALAETEQALARAEALKEFLLDLFRSAEPDRPRDQLPSTEEILALGARRAMDPETAHPPERLGMLLTIALVYMQQNRFETARPILVEALELARTEERDHDLAQALHRMAQLIWRTDRDFDRARDLLVEGERLVAGDRRHFDLFIELRTERGWVERLSGNHDRALELLKEVEESLGDDVTVQPRTKSRFIGALASLNMDAGNLERAAQLSTRAMELEKEAAGPESIYYAIQLVNSATIEDMLGRFDEAKRRLHEAIAIYDLSFQGPSRYRAMARNNLAVLLLETGQYDAAMEEIEANIRDRSGAAGVDPEEYAYAWYRRGTSLARIGRWPDAGAQLRRALQLNKKRPAINEPAEMRIHVLLALVACETGKIEQGKATLAEQDDRLDRSPSNQAEFYESRAVCAYGSGDFSSALERIRQALEIPTPPGKLLDRSRRKLIEARIEKTMGNGPAAGKILDRAEALFGEFGIASHPILDRITATRESWSEP